MGQLQRIEPKVPATPEELRAGRWALIRDLAVFQLKLLVDGLKDIVLSPLALVAGAIDIVSGGARPGRWFRGVLRAGARFDRWVGLFAAVEGPAQPALPASTSEGASAPSRGEPAPASAGGLDVHIAQLERLLVEQHRQGGLTAGAKRALDRALDALEASSKTAVATVERGVKRVSSAGGGDAPRDAG